MNPVTNKVYVANAYGHDVTLIDGASNAASSISTGQEPVAVAVNPATSQIYFANQSDNTVTVVDGASGRATATVSVGLQPVSLAVNPVTNMVYVADQGDNTVTAIDAGNVNSTSTITLPVGYSTAAHAAIALDPVTNTIYVADLLTSGYVIIAINGNTGETDFTAGWGPAIAVDSATNEIYTDDRFNVFAINGNNNWLDNSWTIEASFGAAALAVNPVTNKVYAVGSEGNFVGVIDAASGTMTTVGVGADPVAVAVNPITNRIYVANQNGNSVTVVNGADNNIVATVKTGNSPTSLAVDAESDKIYVANENDNTVTVIDGATSVVSGTIAVNATGQLPPALAVDPATGKVYVASAAGQTATIITPARALATGLTAQVQGDETDPGYISGLAIYATNNPSPSFTATVSSQSTPVAPPASALYYQLETTQGSWQQATATTTQGSDPASYTFSLQNVQRGVHTLYVYPGYGDEGADDATNSTNHSPEIGNLTAYTFVAMGIPTTTTVTGAPNPQPKLNETITFTATVVPSSGTVTPTGSVSFNIDGQTLDVVPLTCASGTCSATDLSRLAQGTHTITAAYSGDANYAASNGTMPETVVQKAPPPAVTLTPSALVFGPEATGSTSEPMGVLLTNTGGQDLQITSIAGSGSFAISTTSGSNNCYGGFPMTLPAGQSCTISVTFTPVNKGKLTGSVVITDNVPGPSGPSSTQTISLSGSIGRPQVSLPASFSLGKQAVGQAGPATNLILKNTGTARLVITSATIAPSSLVEFTISANTCGDGVLPGNTCALGLVFTPAAAGARNGYLTICRNSLVFGLTACPIIKLTGTGVPSDVVSPTSLNFGGRALEDTSLTKTLSITNNSSSPIVNFSATSNLSDYTATGCGQIDAHTSCTLSVTFLPATAGTRNGTLTLSTGSTTLAGVPLQGKGLPMVSLSASVLKFPNTVVGNTATATLTITNNLSETMTIPTSGAITVGGDFAVATSTCPGAGLAQGKRCMVSFTFTPTTTGARSTTLTLNYTALGSPQTVTALLVGAGVNPIGSAKAPVSLQPALLVFGNTVAGQTAASQAITVTNSSTAPVTISSVAVNGTNSDFAIASTNCQGAILGEGKSCTVHVSFTPTEADITLTPTIAAWSSAVLSVTDNASGSPQTAILAGTAVNQ